MKIYLPDFLLANNWGPLYIQNMPDPDLKKFANVVFPSLPLKELTYRIPVAFSGRLELGHRVVVPVGRRRQCGVIIAFPKNSSLVALKDIEDIAEPEPLLPAELISMAGWISEYYMASPGEVIRAMLPSSTHRETDIMIKAEDPPTDARIKLSEKQQVIMKAFENRETCSIHTLEKKTGIRGLRFEIFNLEKLGLLQIHYVLENPRTKPKYEKNISIKNRPAGAVWEEMKKKTPRQAEILLEILNRGGTVPRSDLKIHFSILKRLSDQGWIEIEDEEVFRDPYADIVLKKSKDLKLTEYQFRAVTEISAALHRRTFSCFLLYGVTASGKTQVYIEIVRETLRMNKTALILIPEISLTPQAVQRYRSVFGHQVAVIHSRMSEGERFDSWRMIHEGKCKIALGPRSAIFAPLKDVGVIIVDEEHDASYKQNDPAPRYHARDLAIMRAKIGGSTAVLGSATPSFESYKNALQGKYALCRLPERIDRVSLPQISLVDRNEVLGEFKRRVLSPLLFQKMQACFSQKEQTILLQNRRGYATYLRCQACGHIEACTNCDITLTYHRTDNTVRCHLCGFQSPAPSVCKACNGPNLRYRGTGTQKVEEELRNLFPDRDCLRMDLDTTRTKHAHSQILSAFEDHKADILLGTQMVAKGHDFPGVSLVGVISADTGLLFPDFRAEERTFQILIQAAGRAGRRNVRGEVVIQTFYPDHPIFQFVLNQDYDLFYQYAAENRKILNYPPYGKLIAVRFKGIHQKNVETAAYAFTRSLPVTEKYDILGPVASPIAKKKGYYLFQTVLRSARIRDLTGRKMREAVLKAGDRYRRTYHFPDVRIIIDVDPVDLL